MTVPSGSIDVNMSFSRVPTMPESLKIHHVEKSQKLISFTSHLRRRCAAPKACLAGDFRQQSDFFVSAQHLWRPIAGQWIEAAEARAFWTASRALQGSQENKCKYERRLQPAADPRWRRVLENNCNNYYHLQWLHSRSGLVMRSNRQGWTSLSNSSVCVK